MLLKLICTALLLAFPTALATQEVVGPRVKVLFERPAEQGYAERVAATAEAALDELIPLFGIAPPPITIRLEDTTDLYNALASPLPRRNVGLRLLFPTETALSYRAGDDLELLLLHELTHVVQFSYLGGRGDGLRLGLVGEGIANVPPAWLVEGLAVWTESEFTNGGRRGDALTRGLVESAALTGTWPSLADASLPTYGLWPGGQTEYLFGVGFTAYLIREHGFEGVKRALAQHNASGLLRPFAESWRVGVGTDLSAEWRAWQQRVTRRAEARAAGVRAAERSGSAATTSGWYTGTPALSPDGSQLAWTSWPAALMLAEIPDGQGGALENRRVLLTDLLPGTLEWLDAQTLLYARPVPRPGYTYSELFTLDVRSGRETQLTSGARAKLPAPLPGGCVLYVTDDGVRSSLEHLCIDGETGEAGTVTTRFRTAPGSHLVGLATSQKGRVALSVWRRGSVDVALLEADRLKFLTHDRAQDLSPSWRGERELLFRSDREARGVFELYALALDAPKLKAQSLASSKLERLTRTVGGAFAPEAGPGGTWLVALSGVGYDLAWLPRGEAVTALRPLWEPLPPRASATVPSLSVRPYDPLPSLRPYGWLPTSGNLTLSPLGVAGEASLLAQDDSTDHSARLALGFDSTRPLLAGLYGYARYSYGDGGLALRAVPRPLRVSLQAGTWPFAPHLGKNRETALGFKSSVTARLPQDQWLLSLGLETGLLHLLGEPSGLLFDARAEGAVSTQRTDTWGYRTRGWRGVATGVLSATGGAPSLGAWLDGAYVQPLGAAGRLEFGVRAGYRPAWPIPLELESPVAALASTGWTRSYPTELRFGDGLYALERVTLEPRLRAWWDGAVHVGGDLTVSLDTVLGYGAPVSFSGTLGYAENFWTRVGVRLPL